MAEMNPLEVIEECIEKAKATTDRDLVAHILAETLAALEIDNTEDDAVNMLGAAVAETARKDPGRSALLFAVWTELEQQRQ